jgi:predicted transcriptional regulator
MNSRRSRRSKFEIAARIIEASLEPAKLTDIVYNCRLNFNIGNKYLEHLIEIGLMSQDKKTKNYVTTKKGLEYLDTFRRITNIYGVMDAPEIAVEEI